MATRVRAYILRDDRTIQEVVLPFRRGRLWDGRQAWDVEWHHPLRMGNTFVYLLTSRSGSPAVLDWQDGDRPCIALRGLTPEKAVGIAQEAMVLGKKEAVQLSVMMRVFMWLAILATGMGMSLACMVLLAVLPKLLKR